jgi:hypothetical protein
LLWFDNLSTNSFIFSVLNAQRNTTFYNNTGNNTAARTTRNTRTTLAFRTTRNRRTTIAARTTRNTTVLEASPV